MNQNLPAQARRIISLAPSITEQLFYLGLGTSIIGVTRQCNYPFEAKSIETVGSFLKPDTGRILELAPDTVVGLTVMHQNLLKEIPNKDVNIILQDPHSVRDVLESMKGLTGLAENHQSALERVNLLRHRVDVLRSGCGKKAPVRTYFMISESPLMTPSCNSWQYDALQIAGAVQISKSHDQYERVTLEEAVDFDPQVILSCGCRRGQPVPELCPDCHIARPPCQRIVDDIALQPGWSSTSAARSGHILALPCHLLCRPGPRLIDGLESVAKILQRYPLPE